MLVDYDNVPSQFWAPGPINAAASLCAYLPASVVGSEPEITVRLYGGWKTKSISTRRAQRLVPYLANGHTFIARPGHSASAQQIRLIVELAVSPLGSSAPFEDTYAIDREIRSFRRRQNPSACAQPGACAMNQLMPFTDQTACAAGGCAAKVKNLLVRDEQKMVDTLMVADMAHAAFIDKDDDIVVVTSDTDIWPGVLLALKAGCNVTQIHTTKNMGTPRALVNMLPTKVAHYFNEIRI